MLLMNKKLIQKYYPVVSAFLVAILVSLTALGYIPQKPGAVSVFVILGGTNLILAVTVWRAGKRLEAGFLASASLIVIVMIVVYAVMG